MTKTDPNRSLWAACMGSQRLIEYWTLQAMSALEQGQSENDFVAHCHVSIRRPAKAAYRLAVANKAASGHVHVFTKSKPTATVETCSCGRWRYTENAGPAIVGQPVNQ